MKRFLFIAFLLCACALSLTAQTHDPIMFLEVTQTGLPETETVGVSIRVQVPNREAALALRDEIAGRFFVGIPHQDTIHIHRTDGPCETEPL